VPAANASASANSKANGAAPINVASVLSASVVRGQQRDEEGGGMVLE